MMIQTHNEHSTMTRRSAIYTVVCSMGLAQSPTNTLDGVLGQQTPKVSRRTTQ